MTSKMTKMLPTPELVHKTLSNFSKKSLILIWNIQKYGGVVLNKCDYFKMLHKAVLDKTRFEEIQCDVNCKNT